DLRAVRRAAAPDAATRRRSGGSAAAHGPVAPASADVPAGAGLLTVASTVTNRASVQRLIAFVPGLLLAAAIATVARLVAAFLPAVVSEVTVAILVALVVGRWQGVRSRTFSPGLTLAAERFLRAGIILLGAKLSIEQLLGIGLPAVVVVVTTMAAALALVLGLSRAAGVDGRLGVLLAVGAAVCGNTAIVAASPVVAARPRDTAYAVSTITLFGTIAVFAYPLVGHAIHLADAAFGLWSGIAINDTSQVVAASSAYSPGAAEVATVVKLIRNTLMAPLLVAIAWAWTRGLVADGSRGSTGATRAGIRRAVPLFVLGFLALSAIRSVGLIDATLATSLEAVSRALILVALAAVGLNVRLEELREVGPRPLMVGLGAALAIGTATLLAIVSLGLANGLVVG
ncbi:MAG TPA: putative sulfate exporter family transporter, partial [Candidatus Limnocylindrales bacterium]|nr:putative sulfate exporter family transporter [Candidatus Limnocylindrales bacterium]